MDTPGRRSINRCTCVCVCVFQVMNKQEREIINDIRKCNFNELAEYFKLKSEERKNMSKEEKQVRVILFST